MKARLVRSFRLPQDGWKLARTGFRMGLHNVKPGLVRAGYTRSRGGLWYRRVDDTSCWLELVR